ncbi:MAG TPA: hypothetical protein VM935_04245 [Chitinophagaceae bacterium]|nr:hypothetical protein [Chitinophagaceae bacterium]
MMKSVVQARVSKWAEERDENIVVKQPGMNKENEEQGKRDPNLDIPSEANTTKHINFLDVEDATSNDERKDDASEERRKQWEQGLKEGKEEREKNRN